MTVLSPAACSRFHLAANSLLKKIIVRCIFLQPVFFVKDFYILLYIYKMKNVIILFLIPCFFITRLGAQGAWSSDSSYVVLLNQQIDIYVMMKNVIALDTLYAPDFVFSHGTGKVEGKTSWLATVSSGNYPMRQHDSVTAEMHPGLAIVKGKMEIRRMDKDKLVHYWLRYIRVYALRNKRWQMISHNTTHELHEQ
jgi:hypothetical protein